MTDSAEKSESQADKFRKAARDLETDQSEEAFDRTLKKIAKAPAPRDNEREAK